MSRKFTYEEVKEYFEKEGYELLSTEYKGVSQKLEVICPNGHKSNIMLNNFRRGHRCNRCAAIEFNKRNKHSIEYVKDFLAKDGYELISEEYINTDSELIVKCPNGHIFDTNFRKLRRGNRCRFCKNIYHGEIKIEKYLKNNNIKYITQYKFDDCKFKRQLPFDFYLPDFNILIEYDGVQHYKIKEHFGGYEGFIDTKIRDTIKNIYCKDNNIKLIRISYLDFKNIEKILNKELKYVNTEVS